MAQFVFFRDTKHTIWFREEYIIDADTAEEAKRQFIESVDDLYADDTRWQHEYADATGEEILLDEDENELTD